MPVQGGIASCPLSGFAVIVLLALSIGLFGVNYRKSAADGRISLCEGIVWLFAFLVYAILLIIQEIS